VDVLPQPHSGHGWLAPKPLFIPARGPVHDA
jgi:hypothetical protein